jgi:hypothetical protein
MNELDEETFQALYGRRAPLTPAEVATLLGYHEWARVVRMDGEVG